MSAIGHDGAGSVLRDARVTRVSWAAWCCRAIRRRIGVGVDRAIGYGSIRAARRITIRLRRCPGVVDCYISLPSIRVNNLNCERWFIVAERGNTEERKYCDGADEPFHGGRHW